MRIGVFDSGLGGLTVLRELRAALPGASFLYLGDVARLPYGTRSQRTVEKYALQCARFLESKRLDALVIACHTASAAAQESLQATLGVPVFGIVEAGVRGARATTQNGRVLVLATASTVESEAYPRRFGVFGSEVTVRQRACPLFVPLAEEGWGNHPITEEVVRHYLSDFDEYHFDTLLLGCTHYPLLTASLVRALAAIGKPHVKIVDPAPWLAESLEGMGYGRRTDGETPVLELFATDTIQNGGLRNLSGGWPAFQRVDL